MLTRHFQSIQQLGEEHRDNRVENRHYQRLRQFESQRLPQQRVGQHPIQKLVKEEKDKTEEQAQHGGSHVDAQTHRRREISHQRLHNAEHPQGLMRKRVLRQDNRSAKEQTRDRRPPHQRKIHRHQQRQLQI